MSKYKLIAEMVVNSEEPVNDVEIYKRYRRSARQVREDLKNYHEKYPHIFFGELKKKEDHFFVSSDFGDSLPEGFMLLKRRTRRP